MNGIKQLLQTRTDDSKWKKQFSTAFLENNLIVDDSSVIGPDGNEYISIYTHSLYNDENQQKSTGLDIAEAALDYGFGVVLNKNKGAPDWVFSYADLWALKLTGSIDGNEQFSVRETEQSFQGEIKTYVGPISDNILPDNIRDTIINKLSSLYHLSGDQISLIKFENGFYKYGLILPCLSIREPANENKAQNFISWYIPCFFEVRL